MGLNILIADDSATTRMIIERGFRLADPEIEQCFHASDGQAALALLREQRVDVLITDLYMGGMSGRELIREIRCNPAWRNLLIAVVTSEQSRQTEPELFALGANCMQRKPLTPEALQEVILMLKEMIS